MAKRIMVVDDAPEILESKVKALSEAGFDVDGYQYPHWALAKLAEQIQSNKPPYALVTDTEMPHFSGAALITYISPKTNRNDQVIVLGSRDALAAPYLVSEFRDIRRIEGRYTGKTILTSRQELKEHSINESMSVKGRRQLAVLKEALRICDKVFRIDADGTGIADLIEYVKT